jgi:CDP-diacylglycerol--serine O-phosphatidyltransferase
MRGAIVILPGAFTSGNLFFGIFAIVEASRGNFSRAAWFIVLAGVMDMLDGRIARMSRTGTAFGAELDSLVDVISFGVAPALLLYFHTFRGGEWAWLLCFAYILAAALRLARFNVEQAGHAKSQFFGLPSPAAGMTLATYYPFTQTSLFRDTLSGLVPWSVTLAVLTVLCAVLMVSVVPYPALGRFSIKTWNGRLSIGVILLTIAGALYFPNYFFFLFGMTYLSYGLLRAAAVGFLDRLPERDPLLDEEDEHGRPISDLVTPRLLRFGLKRRRKGGGGAGGGAAP